MKQQKKERLESAAQAIANLRVRFLHGGLQRASDEAKNLESTELTIREISGEIEDENNNTYPINRVSREQYHEAIKIATQFRVENEGFWAKAVFDRGGESGEFTEYFESIQDMSSYIFKVGMEGRYLLLSCANITEKEFNDNYLPF